ncbi:shikimate dehydrogenase [Roseibium aggregatum]|uniref:Shikimate dehydrogenase (NADP(+)) n=1 Tax=Roseibium aggregatum TaxID=187304 RepID=A0A926P1K8_9HYPH|nr:shikimate dehydrogenase [Roseibium aggregatum]MBD1547773.1 shikimate dehydrogenase [Roseibium aggregatum]
MSGAGGTLLAGLVGRGIARSRTPEMHMAEAEALGMRAIYQIIDLDAFGGSSPDLSDIVRAAEMTGFNGLNVTYPFKIDIVPMLDELSPNAAAIGSVNTVVFRNGRRYGHNTDLWGFAESFRRNMDGTARERVVLIGAGGAGAAVAHALADCGVRELRIFDAEADRSERLAEQVCANRPDIIARPIERIDAEAMRGLDGLVNATPVGMAKTPGSPFPADLLDPALWVADIVYFPLETELLAHARARGCRTLPGSGMAVFQAVRAFELFTGIKPDISRMEATFNSFDLPGHLQGEVTEFKRPAPGT